MYQNINDRFDNDKHNNEIIGTIILSIKVYIIYNDNKQTRAELKQA